MEPITTDDSDSLATLIDGALRKVRKTAVESYADVLTTGYGGLW